MSMSQPRWRSLVALATFAACLWTTDHVAAQSFRDLFKKVVPSVVVIRAKGRDVAASGFTRFNETGSGVLVSRDGQVMTAAHVVHAMDEIRVEFLGGETVSARVIASDPSADLSMLQLERVPASAVVSPLGDSDRVAVGDQVMIVGAPYGLSHSMSVGWVRARGAPGRGYQRMPGAAGC